jgi:hypothetical protein
MRYLTFYLTLTPMASLESSVDIETRKFSAHLKDLVRFPTAASSGVSKGEFGVFNPPPPPEIPKF